MDEIKTAGATKGVQDSGSMTVHMTNECNVDIYVSSGANTPDDWSEFDPVDKMLIKAGQTATIVYASMSTWHSTSYWWFQVGFDTSLHPNAGQDVRAESPALGAYSNDTTRFYSNAMSVAMTPVYSTDDSEKSGEKGVGSSYGFGITVSQP